MYIKHMQKRQAKSKYTAWNELQGPSKGIRVRKRLDDAVLALRQDLRKLRLRERRLFVLGKSNKRIYLASARIFFFFTK